MIPDSQTNLLYLADCLPHKQPVFFERLKDILHTCAIPFKFLPGTKDIWAVDYMPVQISETEYVQFTYDPDYLQPKKYRGTITDTREVCKAICLSPAIVNIKVDGGNVVRASGKAIMCDKVFRENPRSSEKELIRILHEALAIDQLIFVPQHPQDYVGHADGMVRFLDENTVLINDYSKEKPGFQTAFRMALYNAGLDWVEIPYNPYNNRNSTDASGEYINYLHMKQAVMIPAFNMDEDEAAFRIFEQIFAGQRITSLDSREIAKEGGILNCISWNILERNEA